MDYNLAKQLKDAGFKFNGTHDYYALFGYIEERGEKLLVPTLSELIEACGEGLWSITRHGNIWQTNWKDGMAGETAGKTPEEAVARLWLKLNLKS